MNFTHEELLAQAQKDREKFCAMSTNLQKALLSEVAEVWPRIKAPLGDTDDFIEPGPLFEARPTFVSEQTKQRQSSPESAPVNQPNRRSRRKPRKKRGS